MVTSIPRSPCSNSPTPSREVPESPVPPAGSLLTSAVAGVTINHCQDRAKPPRRRASASTPGGGRRRRRRRRRRRVRRGEPGARPFPAVDQRVPRCADGVPCLPPRGRRPHDRRLARPDVRLGRGLLRSGAGDLVPRLDAPRARPWAGSVLHDPDRRARRREPHVEHPDDASWAPRLAPGEDRRPDLRIQRPAGLRRGGQRIDRVAGDPPLDRRRPWPDGWRCGLRLIALRCLSRGAALESRDGLGSAAVFARPRRAPGDPASTAVAGGGGARSPEHCAAPDQ